MNVKIEIIPHDQQRYSTVGDWYFQDTLENNEVKQTDLVIRVSKLSDWRREMLVAVHELVEVLKCKHDGISQQAVDDFDKAFEAARSIDNFDEPGDEPSAPYCRQHCLATGIERILAAELGINWKEYESELDELP